jgi:hypothetical protein
VKLNFWKFPCIDAGDAHYEKLPKLLQNGRSVIKNVRGFVRIFLTKLIGRKISGKFSSRGETYEIVFPLE